MYLPIWLFEQTLIYDLICIGPIRIIHQIWYIFLPTRNLLLYVKNSPVILPIESLA